MIIILKIINAVCHILYFILSLGSQCVFYTYSVSQLGLATFQMLKNHITPIATTMDSTGIVIYMRRKSVFNKNKIVPPTKTYNLISRYNDHYTSKIYVCDIEA